MTTIDEVIAEERDNAEFSRCNDYDTSAEYHNQIAEWLEELKCYKNDNDFSEYADRLHKIAFNSGYNKAIDESIEIVKGNYRMEALEKLEQLKAGGIVE